MKYILLFFIAASINVSAEEVIYNPVNGYDRDQSHLEKFINYIKSIKIDRTTKDEVIKIAGDTPWRWKDQNSFTLEYNWMFDGGLMVNGDIKFGNLDKVSDINIRKVVKGASEVLYSKSLSDDNYVTASTKRFILPSSNNPPVEKTLGEIYYNTTDSHFYGWNGKEWRQFDK
jgi:hypothetical protein